jgi:hypothetical protein
MPRHCMRTFSIIDLIVIISISVKCHYAERHILLLCWMSSCWVLRRPAMKHSANYFYDSSTHQQIFWKENCAQHFLKVGRDIESERERERFCLHSAEKKNCYANFSLGKNFLSSNHSPRFVVHATDIYKCTLWMQETIIRLNQLPFIATRWQYGSQICFATF